MTLQLHPPLIITPRLLPGVEVAPGQWISWDHSTTTGFIDGIHPDGSGFEHEVRDIRPGLSGRTGVPEEQVASCLEALCAFLGACAESRSYAERMQRDPMTGENSDLFPPRVGEWAQHYSDEIGMLSCELQEYSQPED
jgi:hypothetical protein